MQHSLVASPAPPGPAGPDHTGVAVLPPKGLNTSVYLDVNNFSRHTAWAHGFMHAYALWLGPVLLVMVFISAYALVWWRRVPKASALLALGGMGTVLALGLNLLVAHAARELRPYDTYTRALVLVAKANDYSFPSDHSVVAGGLSISVLLVLTTTVWGSRTAVAKGVNAAGGAPPLLRAFAAVNVVLGLLLCFARVYVGAHYPGDAVAGYLLAAAVVLALSLVRSFAYSIVDALEPTVLAALLRRPPLRAQSTSGADASISNTGRR
jgi:membrane-associated phospholipid phosphatase